MKTSTLWDASSDSLSEKTTKSSQFKHLRTSWNQMVEGRNMQRTDVLNDKFLRGLISEHESFVQL